MFSKEILIEFQPPAFDWSGEAVSYSEAMEFIENILPRKLKLNLLRGIQVAAKKSQVQIVKNHFDLIFHSPRWFITSLNCSKWRKRKTSPTSMTLKNFSVILNAKENKTFNSNNFCTWKLFRPQNSGLADLKFTFQMTAVRMKDGWERCTLKF